MTSSSEQVLRKDALKCAVPEKAFEEGTTVSPITIVKGGETAEITEWEELESWTKEELIIELVKERSIQRLINWEMRMMIDTRHPIDGEPRPDKRIGDVPPAEWAKKIIEYGKRKDGDDFNPENYGLESDYAFSMERKTEGSE
jgi:hypothetical protein